MTVYSYIKQEIDCRKCVHSEVCKHRERMVEELKKFNEVIQEPPLKINISCEEYREHKPLFREPIAPLVDPPWKPIGTGDPIKEYYTYTTDNTRPRE